MKNRAARASVAAGMGPRAMQAEVWNEVADKSQRMNVASATAAMHDIYDGRRDRLDEFLSAITLHDGQTSALVLIAGRPVVLDHVSRPEVFAVLHGPLVQGYALDALENSSGIHAATRPGIHTAEAFLRHVLRARITEHDGIGIGRDVRFADARVAGAGLVVGETSSCSSPRSRRNPPRVPRRRRGFDVLPDGARSDTPAAGQGSRPAAAGIRYGVSAGRFRADRLMPHSGGEPRPT